MNNKNLEFHFTNSNASAGKGFGNLNTMTNIRFGNASRNEGQQYRIDRETKDTFEFKFNYLNKDYQNPNNIVMPIPRGGESTRKDPIPLNINMIDNQKPIIKFNY